MNRIQDNIIVIAWIIGVTIIGRGHRRVRAGPAPL